MANDITGSDARCPKCKTGHTQPEILNGKLFFICCCGYGKDEYFKELDKQQNTKTSHDRNYSLCNRLINAIRQRGVKICRQIG